MKQKLLSNMNTYEFQRKPLTRMQSLTQALLLFLIQILLLLLLFTPKASFSLSASEHDAASDEFVRGDSIYIGDIITLQISASDISATGISEDEIREKFHEFEIVELLETRTGYKLSLRTFEAGEYTVFLGNSEIIINVISTLDDSDRNDIFEGGDQIIEPGLYVPLKTILFISAGLICIIGGCVLVNALLQNKKKPRSPYQIFLLRVSELNIENDSYFVDLTLCLKEYLERVYHCRIRGKTSKEIMLALREMPSSGVIPSGNLPSGNTHSGNTPTGNTPTGNITTGITPTGNTHSGNTPTGNTPSGNTPSDAIPPTNILLEIEGWLIECDRLKFTGINVTNDEKKAHCWKCLDLIERYEQLRNGAANEAKAHSEGN